MDSENTLNNIYTKGIYCVRLDEVSSNHKLTAAGAIGYLQEAAWKASIEWGVSINDLMEDGLTWMLSRLNINFNEYPDYLDDIHFETWISKYEKIFSQRDLRFKKGDEVLFEAATQWLVIDINTKKLTRLPEHLIEKFLNKSRQPIEAFKTKIPDFDAPDYSYNMTVRWHDLDINQHTNNKHYFRWALDALPTAVLEDSFMKQLDFQFKAETIIGDDLQVRAKEIEGGFLHKIVNQNNKEIIRGISIWK